MCLNSDKFLSKANDILAPFKLHSFIFDEIGLFNGSKLYGSGNPRKSFLDHDDDG